MSNRLRLALIAGCALVAGLYGPSAGRVLAEGVGGPYAPAAAAHRAKSASGSLGAASSASGSRFGRPGPLAAAPHFLDPLPPELSGRLLTIELGPWRDGVARGL